MLNTFLRIKKLKKPQIEELVKKLEIVKKRKINEWRNEGHSSDDLMPKMPQISLEDIQDALTYCIYHYKGFMFESLGLDECPCNCYCRNCEMIPESEVFVRMQDIAQNMGEENVFNEFIEQYTTKERDGIRKQS